MKVPLVSISCITYNHEPYIKDCLDGFLMQQCNFDYEILIHDDASTDGTANIIREYEAKYPDIIKPIYQSENQYSRGVSITSTFNLSRAKGKYIALCEGDDYWTDPLKLQKQADILERHPEYSLVSGGYSEFYEHSGERKDILHDPDNPENSSPIGFEVTLEMFMKKWYIQTLTMMYRNGVISGELRQKYHYFRDVHLIYYLLQYGNGYYITELLGVYRRHEGGIYSQIGRANQQRLYYLVYTELYKNHPEDFREKYWRMLLNIVRFQDKNGRVDKLPSRRRLVWRLFLLSQSWSELTWSIRAANIQNPLLIRIIHKLAHIFGRIKE